MFEVFLQNFLSLSKIVEEFQHGGWGEVGNKIVQQKLRQLAEAGRGCNSWGN